MLLLDCGANSGLQVPIPCAVGAHGLGLYEESPWRGIIPRVCLLSKRAEEEKGNELTKKRTNCSKRLLLTLLAMRARDVLGGELTWSSATGSTRYVVLKGRKARRRVCLTCQKSALRAGFKNRRAALQTGVPYPQKETRYTSTAARPARVYAG